MLAGTRLLGTIPVGNRSDFALFKSGDGDVYVTSENADEVSVLNGTEVLAANPGGPLPGLGGVR